MGALGALRAQHAGGSSARRYEENRADGHDGAAPGCYAVAGMAAIREVAAGALVNNA